MAQVYTQVRVVKPTERQPGQATMLQSLRGGSAKGWRVKFDYNDQFGVAHEPTLQDLMDQAQKKAGVELHKVSKMVTCPATGEEVAQLLTDFEVEAAVAAKSVLLLHTTGKPAGTGKKNAKKEDPDGTA
eukprot:gene130-8535_t